MPNDARLAQLEANVSAAHARIDALEERHEARELSHRALLEAIGEPPNPATNRPGSGMSAMLGELVTAQRERDRRRAATLVVLKYGGIIVSAVGVLFGIVLALLRLSHP